MAGTKLRGYDVLIQFCSGSTHTTTYGLGSEKNCDFDITRAEIDASDKNNTGWGVSLSGLAKATVTMSGCWLHGDTNGWTVAETLILDALGTHTDAKVCLVDTLNRRKLSGPAYITHYKVGAKFDDVATGDITFSGSGVFVSSTY